MSDRAEYSAPASPGTFPQIVAFADNPWRGAWMNRQHVLSRLARRGWPVLYSAGAISLWDRGRQKWRDAGWLGCFEREDGVLLDRAGRWPPRWQSVATWDNWAIRLHAGRLARRVQSADLNRRGIAMIFHPWFLPYAEALQPRHCVFYAYDAFSSTPEWTKTDEALLRRTLERADLVIASSEVIARQLSEKFAREIRVLPNGADVAAFAAGAQTACPPDLAGIPSPRIGYVGNISQKVDLETIAETARRRRDWHWVLVGDPVGMKKNAAASATFEACRRQANIHFLGSRHHSELPAYVSHMDVNTMCYRQEGGWWTSGYPLKLHEYLAAGKPVISADIEAVREFASVIDIARTPDEWIAAITRALEHGGIGSIAQRQEVARRNSWENRLDLLEGWLQELADRAC